MSGRSYPIQKHSCWWRLRRHEPVETTQVYKSSSGWRKLYRCARCPWYGWLLYVPRSLSKKASR